MNATYFGDRFTLYLGRLHRHFTFLKINARLHDVTL